VARRYPTRVSVLAMMPAENAARAVRERGRSRPGMRPDLAAL